MVNFNILTYFNLINFYISLTERGDVIHKYAENEVNCLLYYMLDPGTSQSSAPSTPLSSSSGSLLTVSISSSDSETSRPFKRLRMDDEAFQSSSARDVSLSSDV